MSKAQIPNPNFENWKGNDPQGWWTVNQLSQGQLIGVSPTQDVHSGIWAANLKPIQATANVLVASAMSLSPLETNGISFHERPSNFSVWVKYDALGKDSVTIVASLTDVKGNSIGVAAATLGGKQNEYIKLDLPFSYLSESTPDSLQIIFFVGILDELRATSINSYLLVDDVSLEIPTAQDPPIAPSNLIASLIGDDNQIGLGWLDNSNDETGFVIERSEAEDGLYIEVGTTNANINYFVDESAVIGVTYYYRVRAVNDNGSSNPSNFVEITRPVPTKVFNQLSENTIIYPNPAIDNIHVTFPIELKNARMQVFNSVGAVVIDQSVSGKQIQVPFHLAVGTYFLHINTTDAQQFSKGFIVK
ncbi:MAG: T9SS type A sorting domain-containing protein [Chitinophagales bacterium]|nr:T9SS type A sorting domain-containing protein [Chitinophagales bacterium]